MIEVTITNLLDVPAGELALWVSKHLLDTKLPTVDANTTLSTADLIPLLSVFANKHSLAVEYYNVITGDLVEWKLAKKAGGLGSKEHVEHAYENLKASQDILYRAMQACHLKYEAASRMMSGFNSAERMGRGF